MGCNCGSSSYSDLKSDGYRFCEAWPSLKRSAIWFSVSLFTEQEVSKQDILNLQVYTNVSESRLSLMVGFDDYARALMRTKCVAS